MPDPAANPSPFNSVSSDDSQNQGFPSDLQPPERPWPGLDRLAVSQAIGGLTLGLIALYTSYDHISIASLRIELEQQWGVPFIAASVAIISLDAQLATRARDRAAHEGNRQRNLAREEAQAADRERDRADRERNRAAQSRERQAQDLALLRRSAVLSARVQLVPSGRNRARLASFLTLIEPD